MGKIIRDNKEMEVGNDGAIVSACEELGIAFGCRSGVCSICIIEIIGGMENLNQKTLQEETIDLEKNCRLACQCKIKRGTVKLK